MLRRVLLLLSLGLSWWLSQPLLCMACCQRGLPCAVLTGRYLKAAAAALLIVLQSGHRGVATVVCGSSHVCVANPSNVALCLQFDRQHLPYCGQSVYMLPAYLHPSCARYMPLQVLPTSTAAAAVCLHASQVRISSRSVGTNWGRKGEGQEEEEAN